MSKDKQWIVRFNAGCGDNFEVVDAETESKALEIADDLWREEAESIADYGVVGEATPELMEEHGFD